MKVGSQVGWLRNTNWWRNSSYLLLWLSWYSGHFWHLRSTVRIQSSEHFIYYQLHWKVKHYDTVRALLLFFIASLSSNRQKVGGRFKPRTSWSKTTKVPPRRNTIWINLLVKFGIWPHCSLAYVWQAESWFINRVIKTLLCRFRPV